MYMYVPRRGLHVLMKSKIGSVHPVSGCQADELTCFVNMAVGMKGFMADRNVWRGDYYFHLRKKPLCECVCSMKLLRLTNRIILYEFRRRRISQPMVAIRRQNRQLAIVDFSSISSSSSSQ